MRKKILLTILAIFVIIQFIRPSRNISKSQSPNDITTNYSVPKDVLDVLVRSCYDCHSNNTIYPWYTNIQPAGWWMQFHVEEGKIELNFSEFATYDRKKQLHKLEEIAEVVKNNQMPLSSYTLIHRDAILSDEQKNLITAWTTTLMNEIARK